LLDIEGSDYISVGPGHLHDILTALMTESAARVVLWKLADQCKLCEWRFNYRPASNLLSTLQILAKV
jgi:hypothetical protein